jgi:hypothetical protein
MYHDVSPTFIRRMANICVDAAKTMTDLLPAQPHALFVYQNGPWWSIVHNMMQAFLVFLLELSYYPLIQQGTAELSKYAKKLVRWLRAMQDPLAERAYQIALNTLDAVASRLAIDISDLWLEHATVFPNSNLRG